MIKLVSIMVISLLLIGCTKGEESPKKFNDIVTKYTEIREIISEEIADTFYIYIRLPKYYGKENKRYPVLYLLDGDISFNMAVSAVRYLQFGREVPDLILVAPGYGTLLSDNEVNCRERDYTISKIQRFEESGGAERYLRFLKNELIPTIDSIYLTNDFRVINGYSLGGLFTINTLLEEPALFSGYIAGSPYLIDDFSTLTKKIEEIIDFPLNIKLFLSVGEFEDQERYKNPIKEIRNKLDSYSGVKIKMRTFSEGTHFSTPSQALVYGLKYCFDEN